MSERKTSKRKYLTVVEGEKIAPIRGRSGDIYEVYQTFQRRVKHLKGSNRPAGWFHSIWGGSDWSVEIRWLWTENLGYFAPEIRFRANTETLSLVKKIGTALREVEHLAHPSPEKLTDKLGAVVVEYVADHKEGCWDDYHPLRVPGEPAMVTIARYAE